MKVQYVQDTDTLYIELRPAPVEETKDLDAKGEIVGITIEHASKRADIPHFSFEQIAA